MTKYQIKNIVKKTKTGIGLVVIAALLSQLFNVALYIYTRNTIKTETTEQTVKNMQKVELVENMKARVETAVHTAMADVHANLGKPEMFYSITSNIVAQNEMIVGSAVAMIPGFYPQKERLYAPFAYNLSADGKGRPIEKLLPYDYTKKEWYSRPISTDSALWSFAYNDTEGSDMLIRTYSQPIHNHEGKIVGVLTANVYYENLVVQNDQLYGRIDKVNLVGFILQLSALLLIIFVVIRYLGKLRQVNHLISEEEALKKEIQIAGDIQKSMLANISNDAKKNHHIEIKDCLISAPDVSADFYDYFYVRDKMVFCIGDVPGSNVTAAILMSITRSVFRTAATILCRSSKTASPAAIVTSMNHTLCAINHNQIFSTLLVGLIDMKNGQMTYCNAGNPTPFVISKNEARMLDIEPQIPIGIVDDYKYVEQSLAFGNDDTLFLYNDGLYETENTSHTPYGLKRLGTRLANSAQVGDDPEKILSKLRTSLENHRGTAPQTDDVLMIAIKMS